jgi:hypothetical protein
VSIAFLSGSRPPFLRLPSLANLSSEAFEPMYFELSLFQMAALVAGSLLSYFKPNHKMVIGFLVIVVGILELVFLAGFLFYIVEFFTSRLF